MEDFVNFETAKKLKEKGFRKPCILYYNSDKVRTWFNEPDIAKNFVPTTLGNDDVLAPTISQVLKWLRDERGTHVCITLGEFSDWVYDVSRIDGNMFCKAEDGFKSYEQAALAGVNYCLDNLI